MTAKTFTEIFAAYYRQYRAEATVPTSSEDEWTIALSLANEAVNYWENYDNTYWRELYATLQTASTGATTTITTGTRTYAAPTAMKEVGGNVWVLDASSNIIQTYPIKELHEVQFLNENANFAYFTQAVTGLFTLNLNPAPPSSLNGKSLNYVYYKTATEFSTGASTTEMVNPYFVVHRMLASRFRNSRNPFRNDAKSDAENAIKVMQMRNNSGNWANPFALADTSGTQWGM